MSHSKSADPRGAATFLQKLHETYSWYLKAYPLTTRCLTSAVTSSLANVVGQLFGEQQYSLRNAFSFFIFGFFATGPLTHNLYVVIDKVVPPGSHYAKLLKLLIERLLFAPAFLLLFFCTVPILQGKGMTEAVRRIKESYWTALKANWKAWTLFQYINLNHVPLQHQVLAANIFALFWNIYLSTKQS